MDVVEVGFDIDWVELVSVSNVDIESWVDEYDDVIIVDYMDGVNSYIFDQQINDWVEVKLNQDLDNSGSVVVSLFVDDCLVFLELCKVVVKLGVIGEFNKMEGINVNQKCVQVSVEGNGEQVYVYVVMFDIVGNMLDSDGVI